MNHRISTALLLAATMAGGAHAQQTASATFTALPPVPAPGASVEFAAPTSANGRCARAVAVPCGSKPASKTVARRKPSLAPAFDPLAVHPDAAIKDTMAPAIDLPGVMRIAGADAHALDFSRARVVDVINGGAQTVYVSNIDQNRIQLPWPNTRVVGTDELAIEKTSGSNNVYVQFKEGVQRAVTVYFEQPNGSSVLGLQLVPKRIPAQTILVRDAGLRAGEPKPVKGHDYVTLTQALMEQVALGAAPQGYSQVDFAVGPIAMNGLVVTPLKQYSSSDRDIYVYDVVNPGPQKASLQEQDFDGDDVLAISIFPRPVLTAHEHTRVIVLARKASGG
jgi:conjugal transfer pilus assembly protein TraK